MTSAVYEKTKVKIVAITRTDGTTTRLPMNVNDSCIKDAAETTTTLKHAKSAPSSAITTISTHHLSIVKLNH